MSMACSSSARRIMICPRVRFGFLASAGNTRYDDVLVKALPAPEPGTDPDPGTHVTYGEHHEVMPRAFAARRS